MSPEISRELTVRLSAREATFNVQLTHRFEVTHLFLGFFCHTSLCCVLFLW